MQTHESVTSASRSRPRQEATREPETGQRFTVLGSRTDAALTECFASVGTYSNAQLVTALGAAPRWQPAAAPSEGDLCNRRSHCDFRRGHRAPLPRSSSLRDYGIQSRRRARHQTADRVASAHRSPPSEPPDGWRRRRVLLLASGYFGGKRSRPVDGFHLFVPVLALQESFPIDVTDI